MSIISCSVLIDWKRNNKLREWCCVFFFHKGRNISLLLLLQNDLIFVYYYILSLYTNAFGVRRKRKKQQQQNQRRVREEEKKEGRYSCDLKRTFLLNPPPHLPQARVKRPATSRAPFAQYVNLMRFLFLNLFTCHLKEWNTTRHYFYFIFFFLLFHSLFFFFLLFSFLRYNPHTHTCI